MKITLERLREIITEEVIKEEVAPEDAQRTIVALLQGTAQNVTGDIMGAVYDEMYASDVAVAEPEEEEMRRSIRNPGQKVASLVVPKAIVHGLVLLLQERSKILRKSLKKS